MDRRKPLHEALAAAKLGSGSGGGSGTSDYTQLSNLPSINGTILIGNKTLADLGIEWLWRGTRAEYEAVKATIPPNTFVDITDEPDMDTVPTDGSTNPVESNGVYDALTGKVGTSDYATATTAGIIKPDGVTTEVDENGVISVSTFSPTSWGGVQNIVRAGLASKFFKVRDQLQCMKDNTVLTWDIIGIDAETLDDPNATHSLTLQLHDGFTELQFDNREALFAFPDGLTAGAYKFTVAQSWYAGDVNKVITFTLTQSIPQGGQLVVNNEYNATMVNSTISSYSGGSSTEAIETVTMSEGNAETAATDLGTVTNAGVPESNINSIQRALLGSNNWKESALRQYLNSKAAAGSVWTPKTKYDRPPSWATTTAGFLNGLDPEFVAVLGSVKKVTALNTISDGGGKEEAVEKVFLLSLSEIYAGDEVTGGEGSPYKYYSDYSDYQSPNGGADSNRIKYHNGVVKYWWLRSPTTEYANYVRGVRPNGGRNTNYAKDSHGVFPACVIV